MKALIILMAVTMFLPFSSHAGIDLETYAGNHLAWGHGSIEGVIGSVSVDVDRSNTKVRRVVVSVQNRAATQEDSTYLIKYMLLFTDADMATGMAYMNSIGKRLRVISNKDSSFEIKLDSL